MNLLILTAGVALSFNAAMTTPPYPQTQSEQRFETDCQMYDRLMLQCMDPNANVDEQTCADVPELLRECMMSDPGDEDQ